MHLVAGVERWDPRWSEMLLVAEYEAGHTKTPPALQEPEGTRWTGG